MYVQVALTDVERAQLAAYQAQVLQSWAKAGSAHPNAPLQALLPALLLYAITHAPPSDMVRALQERRGQTLAPRLVP